MVFISNTMSRKPRRKSKQEKLTPIEKDEKGAVSMQALLLLLSGMVALIFQVLWIKQLSLIVGIDVYAVTLGLSTFFAGLALGGLVLGRWVDQNSRPLQCYALLEIGIAILGVVTTISLANSAELFAVMETRSNILAWALIFLLLSIPPFLMGGTLPAITRSLMLEDYRIGRGGGGMYAANTAGAILGAIGCTFVLIPHLGIQGTARATACIGLVAAAGAYWMDGIASPRTEPSQKSTTRTQSINPIRITPDSSAVTAIIFYAIAGGIALGYEVVWSQSLVQFMSTRSFAFSVMLATYLAGLALGAAIFARYVDRVQNLWGIFGLLIASAGMVALLEVTFLGPWLPTLQSMADRAALTLFDSRLVGMCARFAVAALCIVFVPTILLGAAFPAALKLIVDSRHVGRDIGKVIALNTFGGVIGTLVTGFVLVPYFGLVNSLSILAIAAAALGLLAALQGRARMKSANSTSPTDWALWSTLAIVAAVLVATVFTPSDKFASLLTDARGGVRVFYQEGAGGTVAVLEQDADRKPFRRLYIQGVSNTGDAMPSLRYMRLQTLLPLIIHNGDPKSALVIGLGTGITSGAMLRYPSLEQRVVAELLPEVLQAADYFSGNYGAATDPRLDIRLRDGRRELLSNKQTYDLITLEPPPPSAASVVNLYSTEFYELAAARLNQQGIVAQWLPLPTQNDEDSRSLVRSFLDVFPYANLWTTELHEMLLVGSQQSIQLNTQTIIQRFNQPEVLTTLSEVGIVSPEALLATWVTGRAGLESYAATALPVTDDDPRIEYTEWVRIDELQRVLPNLLQLRVDPPLQNANFNFVQNVATQRQLLLVFYQAALNSAAGNVELAAQDVRRVMARDGSNAYFLWFSNNTE